MRISDWSSDVCSSDLLPVYVCPRGTTVACTAANGTLNPNNPFAASGQNAALIGRLPNSIEPDESRTRAYRGALGIKGPITDKWNYQVDATSEERRVGKEGCQ